MTKHWSQKDVDWFKALWADGVSTEDCAKSLGRSYFAIERARIRFRLPARTGNERGRTTGVKLGNPTLHSKQGPIVGEFSSAMKRETDWQAEMWRRLLAR